MIAAADYVKTRLNDQINWYGKKSVQNQKWHKLLQTIKIVLAVSIPVLALMINKEILLKVVISILGALIAIIESVTRLNNHKELWVKYRIVSEKLKREKILFLSQATPYSGADPLGLLISRCEQIMSAENHGWIELQEAAEIQ